MSNIDYNINLNRDMVLSPHEVSSKYSPLALAYIGDSIYDLYIKTFFVLGSNMQPEKYHKKVSSIVSANSQSDFIDFYMEQLTEEEQAVYRRARNSSPHTKAKNATLENYLKATGFEAVLGYLYLSGQDERLSIIISAVFDFFSSNK
ncbi:MAG: ribonuclease III [Eubacterium sp.]|nr:ribonuclease III [Eubacterium sp.]